MTHWRIGSRLNEIRSYVWKVAQSSCVSVLFAVREIPVGPEENQSLGFKIKASSPPPRTRTSITMTNHGDDCYFFFYSNCSKVRKFKHNHFLYRGQVLVTKGELTFWIYCAGRQLPIQALWGSYGQWDRLQPLARRTMLSCCLQVSSHGDHSKQYFNVTLG